MNQVFRVLEGGLMTTLQDEGRRGYKKYGIPSSGPMDPYAFLGGNLLLKNEKGAVGLEFTFPGPSLLTLEDTLCTITGGDFSPLCNGRSLPQGEVFMVKEGSVLSFQSLKRGRWSYLLIDGGFSSKPVLGSSSTYVKEGLGGVEGRSLKRGDVLYRREEGKERELLGRRFSSLLPTTSSRQTLRVLPGPQFHLFTSEAIDTFFGSPYQVGVRWDRMGYFLEGPRIKAKDSQEIISEGLTPGAIQILGDGTPVIMMADAQTIGGYKKIGWVLKRDLPKLAQMERGETFRFQRVSRWRALDSLNEREVFPIAKGGDSWLNLRIEGERYMVQMEEIGD